MALSNAEKIANKKAKLAAGGLTQAQVNTLTNEIRALGGKVNADNFPKSAPAQTPATAAKKPAASTTNTKAAAGGLTAQQKIANKKAKLAAGGLTQKQINTLTSEIRALGGKVNPANFPKAGSTQMPPDSGYKPPAGGGTAPPPAPTPAAPNPASPSTPGPAGPAAVDPATGQVNNPASGYNLQKQQGVVGAQTTANVQAQNQNLNQNRVNQSSAYGGYTWTVGPDGRPVLTQNLSAPQQQMLENEQQRALGIDQATGGMLGQIQNQGQYNFQGQDANWGGYEGSAPTWNQGALGKGPDFSKFSGQAESWGGLKGNAPQFKGYGDAPQQGELSYEGAPELYGVGDFEGTQDKVTNAMLQKFESLNSARFAKQDEDFRQRMADQGIQEGSPEWAKRYQAEVQDPQNQAREQATYEAINRGGAEQSRLFGMSSQARAQATGEKGQLFSAQGERMDRYTGLSDRQLQSELAARQQQVGETDLQFQNRMAARAANVGEQSQTLANQLAARQNKFSEANTGFQNQMASRQQQVGETDQDYANRMASRQQQISEYQTARDEPYKQMGSLLGMRAGVKDPTMQNVYTNDMNPADITGLAAAFKAAKTDKQTTEMQGDTARDVAGIQAQAAKDVASINASAAESGGGDFDGAYRNAQLNSQSGRVPLPQQTGGQQPQPMFSTAVQPQFRMQVGPGQGGIMANNPPSQQQQPFASAYSYDSQLAQQKKLGQANPGMMGTAPAGAQLYAQRRLGAASPASYTGGIMGAYPMMQ